MHRTAVLPLLLAGLLVVSCSTGGTGTAQRDSAPRSASGSGSTAAPSGTGTLDWGRCDNEMAAAAALQCATLDVPVASSDPDGPTTSLALVKQSATGSPSERIGSLVINPGGPGGSGIEFLAGSATAFPSELSSRFDLVSFDPRGVGESSPVRCVDDTDKDEELTGDLSPDSPEEIEQALEQQASFLEGCEDDASDMLTHMSTADVADDLDRIRAALGDEQLSYLGFSYGTSIGAAYATMYPDHVRALVLDGAVSPSATDDEMTLAQAQGFERTLDRFLEACDSNSECEIGPDSSAALDETRRELAAEPVEVSTDSGTRELGVDQFDLGLLTALYDSSLWGTVAGAIDDIRGDGAATMLSIMDRQVGRNPDGTFDNSSDAQRMVNCADSDERPTPDDAVRSAEQIESQIPRFGPLVAWGTIGCIDWPIADQPVPEITGDGAPPILVVGTVGDPATPYEWSEELTSALDDATLLTYEGVGHTAFLHAGACVDDAVVDYLVTLTVPSEGTRCPAKSDSIDFAGLGDQLVQQLVDAGIPSEVAQCVGDGMIQEVGEQALSKMMLEEDLARLTRLITAHTVSCAASAGD